MINQTSVKKNGTGYGYKWFADDKHDVYIILLDVKYCDKLPYKKHDTEWYSTDCIVKSITRFRDGKEFVSVSGRAYFDFCYFVGRRIKGERIFYCSTLDQLFDHEFIGIRNSLYHYVDNINGRLSHIKIVGNSKRIRKKKPLLDNNSTSPYKKYFQRVDSQKQLQVYIDAII